MSSSPEHTVSPSTEAPALSKHELQHLRFKARAPNGKIYSYGKRSRLDNEHRNRATNVVRQSPAFLTATAQEQQDMMDAAVKECDEARKKRGLHTTSMFHAYGVPIIELLPEDLLVAPRRSVTSRLSSKGKEKASKSHERSSDNRVDEDDINDDEDDDNGEEDEKREDDGNDEEDEYLTSPFTPKRSAQREWANIMFSISTKRSRRNAIGPSNSLNPSNALDTPGLSLGSPLVRRDREFRPKPLTWDDENNHIKPGPMSAPMSVANSHPWPTASESGELKQSTYRGMPLIIIDDDEEDGEGTHNLQMNDNPGLSMEWKKMLNM
ncbi:hypothetical protein M438DRAFT_132308 [Aureobasidium pullulans EXF-150]|uniref:Uncharacterized protein n=1 Tax=Aureobasidium pullulans EXF-150 TaxID=1043002 RepID=A0A074XVY2_AURPU|nr:uncharacterized protein M438DRAFT_132308 [Aureobasidium pullulans EXF-150]KEQ87789.1 hypothetical protein M438DRAFT_132308 [Aureobasidium pullulans EXF-150]